MKPDSFPERFRQSLQTELASARFWIELLTLIGLILYVNETRRTNDLTQTALTNAQQNFIKDQAPVITTTPDPPMIEAGKPLRWDIRYTNYGRSPALYVHTCIRAAYGPFPGSVPTPKTGECDQTPSFRSTAVLPQGVTEYSTSLGDKPLTEDDVKIIKSHDGGAVVTGFISYSDVSGHSYESVFCSYRLQSGALLNCDRSNFIIEKQ